MKENQAMVRRQVVIPNEGMDVEVETEVMVAGLSQCLKTDKT